MIDLIFHEFIDVHYQQDNLLDFLINFLKKDLFQTSLNHNFDKTKIKIEFSIIQHLLILSLIILLELLLN